MASLRRGARLPGQLLREYRLARSLPRNLPRSAFDTEHGVDTDGELGGWTYLSDLEIESPNWIHGVNYTAVEPERFAAVMSGMALRHEDFVFVDFGSGKGRALLLASEFPFRRVIGLEFAPALHAIAQENIRKYRRSPGGCPVVEAVCADFLEADLPLGASVLFFFDPCSEALFSRVLDKLRRSLRDHPRAIHLAYVAPGRKEALLDRADFLVKTGGDVRLQICWYRNR